MNDKIERYIKGIHLDTCFLCGSRGDLLYRDLSDHLFGTEGLWNFCKCSRDDCGLLWLDPMPAKEELYKAYETYFTHDMPKEKAKSFSKRMFDFVRDGYLGLHYGYRPRGKPFQRWLGALLYLLPYYRACQDNRVMYLRAKPGGRLLEVGCGSGGILEALSILGWQAEGLEVDEEAANQAQRRGLKVCHGELVEQGYPEKSFDAITMNHVIEHVPDSLSFLKECWRLLKKEGTLTLVTPNNESLEHKIFRHTFRGLDPPRHLYIYSKKSLRNLVNKAGFDIIGLKTTAKMASFIWSESRKISKENRGKDVSPHVPLEKGLAYLYHWLAWAACKFDPNLGAEIILIATPRK